MGLGWLVIVLIGTLPYWLGGVFHGPFSDASISEVSMVSSTLCSSRWRPTTTGATVIDASSTPSATTTLSTALLDCTFDTRHRSATNG